MTSPSDPGGALLDLLYREAAPEATTETPGESAPEPNPGAGSAPEAGQASGNDSASPPAGDGAGSQ